MRVAQSTMNMEFELTWRPFFLDPKLPGGEGKDKMQHYFAKFGEPRVRQMAPMMIQTFAKEGINGYTMEGKVGNTMDSHRLLEHALLQGGPKKQDELCEILFDRYFLKGKALSSRATLLEAAAEASLEGAEEVLSGDMHQERVWGEVEKAYQSGVSGVPHFRIDGGGQGKEVSGGQEAAAFLRIFAALSPSATFVVHGFLVGSQVAAKSLQAKPEYNGQVGIVLGAQGEERVGVRFSDGVELALRPANLKVHAADADTAAVDRA